MSTHGWTIASLSSETLDASLVLLPLSREMVRLPDTRYVFHETGVLTLLLDRISLQTSNEDQTIVLICRVFCRLLEPADDLSKLMAHGKHQILIQH